MTREPSENRDIGEPFPSTDFWEELVENWEDFAAEDALGDDYASRIKTIDLAIKKKLLPPAAINSIVERAQIAKALEPLHLSDPEPVIDGLWTLAGRHLRPLHRKLLGSDPTSTRRQLETLIKAVCALEKALDPLPPVTIDFLQQCHARLPASHRTRKRIDLGDIDLMLSDIGHAAYFARHTLYRDRRQPPKLMRARTLRDAARIIEEATGEQIAHSWSQADQKRFAFSGAPGLALRRYMALVEPGASERALVEDLIALRRIDEASPV